ncbi:hypothetical protein [uncultured Brachyspira sp.]|uniref:hypothetical protein n=1 Tax=uncultured Brachyspira sp. TaxID=221953 RepID=UPI0025E92EE2|nr:hypothetical protein [uncultured Brachyspira sp.]
MNKWHLRKVNNKYELYHIYDDLDEEIPISVLLDILKNEYPDIIIKNVKSDIMNGIYSEDIIINNIVFTIYEELSSITFSSYSADKEKANNIIYYIGSILKADIQ